MRVYAGTSGFSFREWKGAFYPQDLPAGKMLGFYARKLPAVEINSTFYRMPRAGTLAEWTGQVPPAFRFVLKAPRKITHARPLNGKGDALSYFLQTAVFLGEKMGAILFQLPPYLHRDIGLFSGFVDQLPPGTRTAFEFRHPSWFDEEVFAILRKKGFALCCTDSEDEELNRLVVTADWGYVRLRRPNYPEAELLKWARKIGSQNWRSAFVFFKHEDGALGPKFAARFLEHFTAGE